ncbi:MAG: polymer-forming cytoskeletal protein [Candidatus Peribacteraceae bacterium]
MKHTILSAILSIGLLAATPVSAAAILGAEMLHVTVPINDDLYAAGGQITIQNAVGGDAALAGGELLMTGTIGGDAHMIGGRIDLRSAVADDAHLAGGEIRISSTIADNLFVTGGRVTIAEGAVIGGNVYIAGGEVFLDGTVRGDVFARGGRLLVRGNIEGSADIAVADFMMFGSIGGPSRIAAERITLANSASFGDDILYWQRNGAMAFTGALEDGAAATYDASLALRTWNVGEQVSGAFAGAIFMSLVYSTLFAVAIIMLLAAVTQTFFRNTAQFLRKQFWASLLMGFLYFVAMPVAIVLLFLTVLGIPIAIVLGFLYALSLCLARPLAALVLARAMELNWKRKWGYWAYTGVSILAYVVLLLLSFIPFLGWFALLIVICAAFGALLHTKWTIWKKVR